MKNSFTKRVSFLFSFLISFSYLIGQNANTFEQGEYNNNVYVAIEKDNMTEEIKSDFSSKGAKIKAEYNDGTLIYTIPTATWNNLKSTTSNQLFTPVAETKISKELKTTGHQGVAIVFFEELTATEIQNIKSDFGLTDNEFSINKGNILIVNADASALQGIAALPNVAYIDALVDEPVPLCDVSESFLQAGRLVNNNFRGLSGKDMVVGIGDGGEFGNHIDFNDRVYQEAVGSYASYADHGDKVAGLFGGAGNINEKYAGLAPDVKIVNQKTYRIFYNLEEYYEKYDMKITNNSYGSTFACNTAGKYEYYSTMLDQQMMEYEDVLHIVAAGNSGLTTCSDEGYPVGYGTILRTYAPAKNVLTVGAAKYSTDILNEASKGPTQDGRIKPEITSLGWDNYGPSRNFDYSVIRKTSASTGNTTGIATLLYERYKELYDINPKASLIKAILCNTALDKGNAGPDYAFGFGIINAEEAIKSIEEANFFLGDISSNGDEKEFSVITDGTQKELKIMLYWNDTEQLVYDVPTLVNDLDLVVVAPDGTEFQPWILDHTPANVTNPATRGVDRINNIEQVTIPTTIAGKYTVKVKGHNVVADRVKFVVTHTTIKDKMEITFPNADQKIIPGERFYITWDANIDGVTGYKISNSFDGGSTWNVLNANLNPKNQTFRWIIPAGTSVEDVKVKVEALGTSYEAVSEPFHIIPTVTDLTANPLCGEYFSLNWTGLDAAASYEVYMLQNGKMEKIGNTTDTEFFVEERINKDEDQWFAIRTVTLNGNSSRRSIAISATPSGIYPCEWSKDVQVSSLSILNDKGRELTSLSLSPTKNLSFDIFNAGTDPVKNIPVTIQVGDVTVNEIIYKTLTPGETYTYTSTNTFDLTNALEYDIVIDVNVAGDSYQGLDVLESKATQIANTALSLPIVSTMEQVPAERIAETVIGVDGASHCDFYTANEAGYIKAYKTEQQLGQVLKIVNNSSTNNSELVMTRNLINYENNDVYLRMFYSQKVDGNTNNKATLEVRGEDTDEWVKIIDLDRTGEWVNTGYINISSLISAQGQKFSTSSQLRIVANGTTTVNLDGVELKDYQSTLPVELEYFKATKIEENALLEWKTASEENNAYFEVQVAKGDEAYREGNFITIDIVEGFGTTAEEQYYQYNDIEKFKSGVRYYRLKQVDFDGKFEYSDIETVYFEDKPEFDIKIYPNPVISGNGTNIFFEMPVDSDVSFVLTDVSGKILTTISDFYPAGNVTITLDIVRDLPPGVYYLAGTLDHNRQVVGKILKVND